MKHLLSILLLSALATPVWAQDPPDFSPFRTPEPFKARLPSRFDNQFIPAVWDYIKGWRDALFEPFKTSITQYGMSDYAAGEQSISFRAAPAANPITFTAIGTAVVMVVTTATTANVGAEIDPDIDKHEQERKNQIALKRYLRTLDEADKCSKAGGTPVVTSKGVQCVPPEPPKPPNPLPCPYGKAPDGTCYNQPQQPEDKSHGGGQGRPHNDNSTDPWAEDQDCWQIEGVWYCT